MPDLSDDHSGGTPADDDADDLLALLAPGDPVAPAYRAPVRPDPLSPVRPDPMAPVRPAADPALDVALVPPAAPGGPAPERAGNRFQPLARAFVLPGDGPADELTVVAQPGTAVHAVAAGTAASDAPDAVEVVAEDGLVYRYGGLARGSVTVRDGDPVPAGAILGAVAAGADGGGGLRLRVRDQAGTGIDVAGLLVGLPDPGELGYATVGTGADADPDALDRVIIEAEGIGPGRGRTR